MTRGDPVEIISSNEPDGELEARGQLVISGHQAAARAAEKHGHKKLAQLHHGLALDAALRLATLTGTGKR